VQQTPRNFSMLSLSKLSTATLALACMIGVTHSATPAQWRSRSIYQLLTDRFARTDLSTTAACPQGYGGYCGGTWQGIVKKLDYIQVGELFQSTRSSTGVNCSLFYQGMGFDAIWISPITKQIADPSRSYHGYSQQDIYQVNNYFGSAQDLKNLSAALHARGMVITICVASMEP